MTPPCLVRIGCPALCIQHGAEAGLGFGETLLADQRQPEVGTSIDLARSKPKDRPVLAFRFAPAILRLQRATEVVVGKDVATVHLNRTPEQALAVPPVVDFRSCPRCERDDCRAGYDSKRRHAASLSAEKLR